MQPKFNNKGSAIELPWRFAGRGRESFSEKACTMWLVVARKRLPTPYAHGTTKRNPSVDYFAILKESTDAFY